MSEVGGARVVLGMSGGGRFIGRRIIVKASRIRCNRRFYEELGRGGRGRSMYLCE